MQLENRKIKIARIVSVPISFTCLDELVETMEPLEFQVSLISSYSKEIESMTSNSTNHIPIHIERKISPFKDLVSVIEMYKIFRIEKFLIVHSHTPKAGLLVALSSFFARVPIRIHTFTGQVWSNYRGIKKILFIFIDRIISELNTINYTDSFSQRNYLLNSKAVRASKLQVMGNGSHYGINFNKFVPLEKSADEIREGFVIGFIGRLSLDKGICELVDVFLDLASEVIDAKLMLIGPIENIPNEYISIIQNHEKIIWQDFVRDVSNYLEKMDIFVFPSKREGFPLSVLEASLMKKPVILSNIYGNKGTVIDGETGFYFELNDLEDLKAKILNLYSDKKLRNELGEKARRYVIDNFNSKELVDIQINEYRRMISNHLNPQI